MRHMILVARKQHLPVIPALHITFRRQLFAFAALFALQIKVLAIVQHPGGNATPSRFGNPRSPPSECQRFGKIHVANSAVNRSG